MGDRERQQATYKVVLVGDSAVGKTKLLASFAASCGARRPAVEDPTPTIGCEMLAVTLTHPEDGTRMLVQLWDTAGQERYRAIGAGHYRRASGALLVYDVTRPQSLTSAVGSWFPELAEWPLSECLALVGNKCDLLDGPEPPSEQVSELEHYKAAKAVLACTSGRTSAKTGCEVSETIMGLVCRIHEAAKNRPAESEIRGSSSLAVVEKEEDRKCTCA